MEKGYKFRLYPTKEQMHLIEQTFGCCRYVYNEALSVRRQWYKDTGQVLSKYDLMRRLPALKAANPWLRDVDAVALQAAIENMDSAYRCYLRGLRSGRNIGLPRYKTRKHDKASYRTKQGARAGGKAVWLPKVGWVKCKISTPVRGRILSATVSRSRSGKYFVSFCCTDVPFPTPPASGSTVGIDLGLKSLAVTSDGKVFESSRYLQKSEKRIAMLQRRLSRKTRDSHRWEKARKQLARLCERVARRRADALHKLTTELVRQYDILCIESLFPGSMSRASRMVKSRFDAAWGTLVRQLEYKCRWYGRTLVKVDRYFPSSQRCSTCGRINPAVRALGVREWACPFCGSFHDRDVNAAINLKQEGLRLLHMVGWGAPEPDARGDRKAAEPRILPHDGRDAKRTAKTQELMAPSLHTPRASA